MIIAGNIYAGLTSGTSLTGANNGLSISGTIVQLGGPLIQNTSINIGTNTLTIFDPLGGASLEISPEGADNRVIMSNLTSGYTGSVSVAIGGVVLLSNNLGLAKEMILQHNPGTGIQVIDTDDNIGLNGSALFAISGPNQYAQYGNLGSPAPVGTVNQR